MRNKLLIILFLLFLITNFTEAQDSKYFDAPFGGGGGYTPGWVFPNMDAINKELVSLGIPGLSESGFYSSGGAGFIYIGFIKNLRIGGMGYGGSTTEVSEKDDDGFIREVRYSLSGGGLTVESSIPVISNIGISLGAVIGAGSIRINVYNNDGNFNWDDLWNGNQNPPSQNFNRSLRNGYFLFSPTLNVDIPIYRFISFRIGGGYQITFGGEWVVDNDQKLANVPTDLNGNTFFLQTGILLGFFSF
jgi:hypothetical protein